MEGNVDADGDRGDVDHTSFFLTSTVPTFTTAYRSLKKNTGLMDVPPRQTCLGNLAGRQQNLRKKATTARL